MTIFKMVNDLCDQWERRAESGFCPPLPSDGRHLITQLARQIVMDAASQCDKRANRDVSSYAKRHEAMKCGAQIRHNLLCEEGESICLRCDGTRCVYCAYEGIKRVGRNHSEEVMG